ncbi:MAG: hypothetical protein K2X87_19120, partial [Gemmataceae bacterium]|nr:hypothetical protein [Gemmataceae bacterium]
MAAAKEQAAAQLSGPAAPEVPLTAGVVARAWSPWVIMAVFLVVSGVLRTEEKAGPLDLGVADSFYEVPVPTLHNEVGRAERLRKPLPAGPLAAVAGAAGVAAAE